MVGAFFWIAVAGVICTGIGYAYAISTRKKKSAVLLAPKVEAKDLKTEEAKSIWKKYTGLSEEFKRFPDLFDALMTLDEKAVLENQVDAIGGLRHSYSCIAYNGYRRYGAAMHKYEADDIRHYCYVCAPYKELRNAVNALINAQKERHRVIEESKKDLTRAELESRMVQHQSLAEQMRAEANIYREVTDEVYGGP